MTSKLRLFKMVELLLFVAHSQFKVQLIATWRFHLFDAHSQMIVAFLTWDILSGDDCLRQQTMQHLEIQRTHHGQNCRRSSSATWTAIVIATARKWLWIGVKQFPAQKLSATSFHLTQLRWQCAGFQTLVSLSNEAEAEASGICHWLFFCRPQDPCFAGYGSRAKRIRSSSIVCRFGVKLRH